MALLVYIYVLIYDRVRSWMIFGEESPPYLLQFGRNMTVIIYIYIYIYIYIPIYREAQGCMITKQLKILQNKKTHIPYFRIPYLCCRRAGSVPKADVWYPPSKGQSVMMPFFSKSVEN